MDSIHCSAVLAHARHTSERKVKSTQTRNGAIRTAEAVSLHPVFSGPAVSVDAASRRAVPDTLKSESTTRRATDPSSLNVTRRNPMNHLWNATCFTYGCCIATAICVVMLSFYALTVARSGESLMKAARHYIGWAPATRRSLRRPHGPLVVEVIPNATEPATHSVTVTDTATLTGEPESVPEAELPSWCSGTLCEYNASNFQGSSVNPCDNFYKFACSRWISDFSNRSRSFDTDQNKETENILQALLTRNNSATLGAAVYELCKNEVSLADSKAYITSLLRNAGFIKWPNMHIVLSKADLWRIHARIFRLLGMSLFVSVSVASDPESLLLIDPYKSKLLINLDVSPSLLHASTRLPNWYLSALYTATSYFDSNYYEGISQRVLKFVSKLAQLKTRCKERAQVITLDDLRAYVPLIKYTVGDLHELTLTTPVAVKCPAYFSALEDLVTHAKSADVYNFFGFRVVLHLSPVLSKEFDSMGAAEMARITGRWQTIWPRWQRCLWFVDDMDPVLLLNSFTNAQQYSVFLKIREVTKTFTSYVKDLEWCAKERSPVCLNFIHSTDIQVGKGNLFIILQSWRT